VHTNLHEGQPSSPTEETALIARALFAIDLDKKTFLDAWNSADKQRQVAAVTHRILFADFLRYRTRFVRPSYSFGVQVAADAEITGIVRDQLSGLTLYLLCTCIDVLTGQGGDFLDFPRWLTSGRGIEDAELSIHLQGTSVSQASSFRMLIRHLHEEHYLPRHGGRRGFAAFFSETIPVPLQDALSSIYCIVPNAVDPGFDDDLWSEHLRSWGDLSTLEQMTRLGQYLYDCRRNPYTHAGAINLPHPGIRLDQGSLSSDFYSSDDVFTASRNGKARTVVRRFRGLPGEDEILVLRLVVAMGSLAILGIPVDGGTVDRYRLTQLRRESIYYALYEIDSVIQLVDVLQNAESLQHFEGMLPTFPMMEVQRVLQHYALDQPHARGNYEHLIRYLQAMTDCNASSAVFNRLHQRDFERGAGSRSTWTSFVAARSSALAELGSSAAIRNLRQLAQSAYWRLNEDVDRWDW
jgi:hypothetical protein